MAWVQQIPETEATGKLVDVYRNVKQRAGKVPHLAQLQSLRPETMAHGFALYCELMDSPSGLGKRERILIATVVSKTNGCFY